MDWLLSYDEAKAPPSPKATSALETLLRNLAARQSRRPGLGVRLFVQGCVLAGCDYAPNKLTGVGLVNAFKHIRDNAFRNDSVRFAKVLEAMPRKHKLNIDTNHYEMILAKSEAVFYYHLVRYPNKSVKPLCEPQRLEPEKDAPHCFKHHSPQMARFGEDWSFLGESQQHNNQRPGNESPPLKEIVICDSKFKPKNKGMVDRKATGSLPAMFATGRRTTPTRNPYVKTQSTLDTRKRPRNDGKLPLDNLDPNQERLGNNFFSKFARDCKLEKNLDPRFVKRRFSTLDKNLLSPQVTANESGQAQICKDKKSTPFEYDIANTNIVNKILPIEPDTPGLTGEQWRDPFIDDGVEVLFDSSVDAPTFFDLTDSNSEPFPINLDGVEDDDEAISKIKPARVSLDDTVDLRRNLLSPDLEAEYDFQLPEPSPNLRKDRLRDFDVNNLSKTSRQVSSRSRYFATSQSNRLTNDLVQDETIIRGDSISPKMQHSKLEYDDIIESPNDSKQHFTNLYSGRSTGIKPTRLSSSFPKLMNASTETTPGPSLNAFKKQEKQCYTSTSLSHARPWVRSFRPSQKRQCSPKNGAATVTLKSYFPSVKQPSTDFNQLQYNTNPTDEDFLWNDS